MPRGPCSRTTNRTQHACTCILLLVSTLIGTCLVCCFVQGLVALFCAVLCCARGSDTQLQHTYSYILLVLLLLYTGTALKKTPPAKKMEKKAQHCCTKCSRACRLSPTLLAIVVVCTKESTAKHDTARHSTAQHRAARQGTTGHDTARYRTAVLCCPFELAELS